MESYRHFYLYAKNWYKTGDLIEDMKKITAHRCGMDANLVSTRDIISVLTGAAKHHIDFEKFMDNLMRDWFYYKNEQIEILLIKTMLTVLMKVKAKDIPWLGKPDASILPLPDPRN